MILVIDDKIKYRHSDYATACCYAPRHMNNFVFITDARLKWKKSNIRFWYKLLLCVKNYERRIRYWCQSSIKKKLLSDSVGDDEYTLILMSKLVLGTSLINISTLDCVRHSICILEYVVNIPYSYSYRI